MGRIEVNIEVNVDRDFLVKHFPFAPVLHEVSKADVFIPPPHLTDPPEPPLQLKIKRAIGEFGRRIENEPHLAHELVVHPYHLIAAYVPTTDGAPSSVNLRLDLDEFSHLWEGEKMADVLVKTTFQMRGSIAELAQARGGTEPLFHIHYPQAVVTYLEEQVYKRRVNFERFWQFTEELLKVERDTPTETIHAHTQALNNLRSPLNRLALFIQEGLGLTRGITAEHASNWLPLFSLFHDCNNILSSHLLALDLTSLDIEEEKKKGYPKMRRKNEVGLLIQEICRQQRGHYSTEHPRFEIAIAGELDHLTLTSVDQRFALRRIFTNFVVNALKNSKPDVSPVIKVRSGFISYQDQPHLAVVIEDEGTGMTSDFMREKLGIPGQREGGYSGDGQGVSGSLKLLDQLGGHLRVASVRGKGAAFAMVIPTSGLELGVVNGVSLEEQVRSSGLSLEGINHPFLFDDGNRITSSAATNLFIMERKVIDQTAVVVRAKPKVNWKGEFFGNAVSDAPFEILYFALPQKVRDFVPEEAHVLFSVGAMRVVQFLPFMPKTSIVSLKGMASFMLPMAIASLGWDLVGGASGIDTLEQEQLANNLLMSVTGTAMQYGAHRVGMAKVLPYFGYALGGDILLGGVFSLAALALEQMGVGSLAAYRMDHLAWDQMIQKKGRQVPLIGGALAMAAGTFSNTSYALGYLLVLGEQMLNPDGGGGLLGEVDQLKREMVSQAETRVQTILDKAGDNPESIQQALWDHRHDATMNIHSLYIVAEAARYSNQKSRLSLLTKAFDRKAHWSTGTRRIQIVDEGALRELGQLLK